MQIDYIKNLAEAYVIDNKLYKENLTKEELFENFYGLIKEVRLSHPDLAAIFENSNKFEQRDIFKNYFDIVFEKNTSLFEIESLEQLNEIEITLSTIGYIALALILLAFKKPISKKVFQVINSVSSFFNRVGKAMANAGSSQKLAYAIIQKNTQSCYKKCEFDPEEAGFLDYFAQFKKGSFLRNTFGQLQSEKSHEKGVCLRECYLNSLREIVKLSAHSYFNCLKSTGDLSKLPLERDFTAYQNILVNSNLSQTCDSMGSVLKEAFENYNTVLDLVYSDNTIEIRKQRNELMMDIYNIQKDFSKNENSYQPKQFQKQVSYNKR